MDVLVTGGAGFIGSHLVKRLLRADDVTRVTVLDALTYAGHIENLREELHSPRLSFVKGTILDQELVDYYVRRSQVIVHLAAESHVDRSFYEAGTFLMTNVLGTQMLLDAAHRFGVERFVHVSTDEVYGPLPSGTASERDPLRPTVPYAASKAASDLIALSYHQTFGVPVCVTRSSNNYGPCQHPEKLIPLSISRLLRGEQVTLHGRGEHVRNWLHVDDNCAALELVLRNGEPGEIYNIGGGTDMTTRELTGMLLAECGAGWDAVTYVPDRRSNDIRYAMDWSKIRALGFEPERTLKEGLADTVRWYRDNPDRWAPAHRDPTAPKAELAVDSSPTGA
ncbi:dTDP-glucose 4,6-dehydratase [Streptomyces hundungensis]|uniref:dTDP-glucose 4,6-dehydratase n=1 Tax=Streptomyces hundungensis TaxID=1077946 RepID=A0A387H2Q9_9ACTN|nr:dTDP-glucose 4,6-dehydratase [Streptomyces hundungensis]AYG77935.1 dTDP-glucose 4,6-dehydratase [Streptomyces hundungensis]